MSYESDNSRVVEALRFGGCKVTDIYALVNSRADYPAAVPVLIELLSMVNDLKVREGILRALSTPRARSVAAANTIVEELKRALNEGAPVLGVPWAAANALSVIASDDVFEDVVTLLRDRRAGKSREMLALALGRMRNPRAVDVLVEALRDEQIAGHAIAALGQLRAARARLHIEQFIDHPKAWIRKEARKALTRLDT